MKLVREVRRFSQDPSTFPKPSQTLIKCMENEGNLVREWNSNTFPESSQTRINPKENEGNRVRGARRFPKDSCIFSKSSQTLRKHEENK